MSPDNMQCDGFQFHVLAVDDRFVDLTAIERLLNLEAFKGLQFALCTNQPIIVLCCWCCCLWGVSVSVCLWAVTTVESGSMALEYLGLSGGEGDTVGFGG